MLKISKNIIFSTEVLPVSIPKPREWWYCGLEHDQYISFCSIKTLKFIVNKNNAHYYYARGEVHIFSEFKIPFYIKYILKPTKIGLHGVLEKLNSKALEDHIKVGKNL